MTMTQRIAAAVMITLGALTLYVMFGIFNAFGPSVAFADVANKLKEARTIQYTSSVTLPGKGAIAIRTLAAEPDRLRTEMPDGAVTIHSGDTALVLNPKGKTATRMKMSGEPKRHDETPSIVDAIRSLGQQKGEPLGERVIDGTRSVGFRTNFGGRAMSIWADEKTAAPVRVELTMAIGGGDAEMVMDKFVLDAPLADALFSLEPPAGYALNEQQLTLPEFGKLEEDVADLLRMYSDAKGGAFPPALTDWAAFHGIGEGGKTDPQVSMKIGGVSGRLFAMQAGYGYAGKDARRGDKDRMVFWYKPDGSDTYKAVFGDLRIEDVAPDQLPATQPAPAAR